LKILSISREPLRTLSLGVGLFGLFVTGARAIDPHRATSQYVRDRWGTEQGFPRGAVYAITQTSDGYLWIGSEAGLVRFDGLNFKVMKDESAMSSAVGVLGIVPDKEGYLWLLTRDMTLLRYRDGDFDNPFNTTADVSYISVVAGSNRGELLAGKLELGAFTYRAGDFSLVAAAKGIPNSPVIAMAQSRSGDIWLGTFAAGLFRLVQGNTFPVSGNLPDAKVNCLLPDGPQALWVGTDHGIVRWNGEQLSTDGIPAELSKFQVLTMTKDHDGNLWLGTGERGLLRFNPQGISPLDRTDLDTPAITATYEDREGSVWFGSANGIQRLRDSAFVTYSMPEGLPAGGGNPVFVDADNRMWFAPVTGGLEWMRGERHGHISQAGLDRDVVYSIAGSRVGGKDELWLGRQNGGLTRLSENGAVTYTHREGLAQDSVYSVYRDHDGVVWAGTLSGGVSRLEAGKFRTYTAADGLASNTVASILQTADGTMWFATTGGLSALANGKWRTYTLTGGLPSDNVNCMLEDSAGFLWAGTTAGLAVRRSANFTVPAGLPAPLREQILGIAEDGHGLLWIATSNHVLRVNRAKLLKGTLGEGDVRQYGLADGLRGLEGVKRHQSVVSDSLGRIWFSLNLGISVVNPARLTNSSIPAMARIQGISADNATIDLKAPVRIPSGRRRVVLSYAAVSLSLPERVRYRYRLDGFDRGWSEPHGGREAVYTNLAPGPYTFRVVASNPDGVWNSNETALTFSVDPAFWQARWLQAGALFGCVLTALALYRLRLRQLTARLSMRFEERLAERTRIAQELHDTLLQGFLSASMQVHVAADQLPPGSQVKPALTRALGLMRQVIDEGRTVVRGLRSTPGMTLDLEQAFSRIPDELASREWTQDEVNFRVIVDGDRRALRPVLRDEVYSIGREALINAFRHSHAKTIEIELSYSPSRLRLLVRDDGRGIDPETLSGGRDGHWGLQGMRERAERIRARLKLLSAVSRGTEIELSVPGYIAFQDQPGSGFSWFRSRGGNPPE
jgi:signal transduction histidine kinase/ligand-binding sensor domain-containing protein